MPAKLIITNGPAQGQEIILDMDNVILGRHPECSFTLQDTRISAKHCRIFHSDNQYFVEDLKSRNGTIINHRTISAIQSLNHNDLLILGDTYLRFQQDTENEQQAIDVQPVDPMRQVGDYYLLNQIGKGATSEIFKAKNIHTGEIVALKIFYAYRLEDVALQRFLRESKVCMSFNHPKIIKVFDFAMFDDKPVIIMEYVEGKSLASYIKEYGKLPNKIVLKIAMQLTQGLYYTHQKGIIHRDLNPANIIIMPKCQIKIIDFGIMKVPGVRITMDCQVLGSLNYIPPEQVDNASNVDIRADIYAIGATMYHALLGKAPYFDITNIHALTLRMATGSVQPLEQLMDIPHSLSQLVAKAMAFNKEERFPTTKDMFNALHNEWEKLIH